LVVSFFGSTRAAAFFRPDRMSLSPSRAAAVKDGRPFSGHPKGLSLTDASTAAAYRRSARKHR